MQRTIRGCMLELAVGDITCEHVDAIVNAANRRLAGGGGVDGAIHRAGGPEIMKETDAKYPSGCATGSAVISGAGNLNAKYVLHAVGPVWGGGTNNEPEQLASAYRTCLQLAAEHGCRSVAFPAISTGVYGYPMDQAARTALATTMGFLKENDAIETVRFVLFSEGAFGAFAAALDELMETEEERENTSDEE